MIPGAGDKNASDRNNSAKKFHKLDEVLFFMTVDNFAWILV